MLWRLPLAAGPVNEHPFAQYVRALGRGRRGARSLERTEAEDAMRMILAGEVEPVQLGAFLMLLRIKEETPDELAGFASAARARLDPGANALRVDLDWGSYSGKRRQLPWYLLSALLVAGTGVRVLMHGTRSLRSDRIYAPDAVQALGLPLCRDFAEAGRELDARRLAFIELERFCPALKEIMDLRRLFGLRSPVNSLLRMLNPAGATHTMMGIFHPRYREVHQEAALALGQPHLAVFKGEGGEVERNPDLPCPVSTVHEGVAGEEDWPRLSERRHLKDESMDPARLRALWRGEIEDAYGTLAAIGTAAIALRLLGRAPDPEAADRLARELWETRDRSAI